MASMTSWFLRAFGVQAVVERIDSSGGEGRKGDAGTASAGFQMPLHYPRYTKEEYERMEEWKVDMVLKEYGLACDGSVEEKRDFAIGAFLWPDQYC